MLMLHLLDIAIPGRPYHRPHIIHEPDTVQNILVDPDTSVAPEGGVDSLLPQELMDTLNSQEGIIDTLRSAAHFFTDFGGGASHPSSLLMTAMVVVAALTLCGGFVWMYRRNLQRQGR